MVMLTVIVCVQLRSLKYVLLPDSSSDAAMRGGAMPTVARSQRNRRTQFLFIYSYMIQFVFMWILSRQGPVPSAATTPKAPTPGTLS